jgi:hypothetical protein
VSTDSDKVEEAKRIILDGLMPVIIRNLIINGILDTSRLSEVDYIFSEINNHPQFIDNLNVIISIDRDFIESARDAIAINRPEVAIVLISTVIEHQLNMFYREVLNECSELEHDTVTTIIKSNSLSDKTGWLFRLVLQEKMDIDLQKKLIKLVELRNQIVHYKAVPQNINNDYGGSYTMIRMKLEELNFNEVFTTLTCLSNTLEDALRRLKLSLDDYKHTEEAMQAIQNFFQDDA